jgi:hypothetical protein
MADIALYGRDPKWTADIIVMPGGGPGSVLCQDPLDPRQRRMHRAGRASTAFILAPARGGRCTWSTPGPPGGSLPTWGGLPFSPVVPETDCVTGGGAGSAHRAGLLGAQ